MRSASNHTGSAGATTVDVPVEEEMAAFDQFGPQMRRLYLLAPLLMSAAGNLREIRAQEQRNKAKIQQMYQGISEVEAARMAKIDLNHPQVDAMLAAGVVRWMTGLILKERGAHDAKLAMVPMVPTCLGSASVAAARNERRMERMMVRLRLRPKKWRRRR